MRSVLLITIVYFFSFSTKVFSQKREILTRAYHPQLKKASIKAFLDEINSRSGIIIEYTSMNIELQKIVELDGTEASLGMLFKKILTGQRVSLLERANKIILAPSTQPINTNSLVPSYQVFGFVKENASEEPMIDATIMDISNPKPIVSNAHGYFSFTLPEGDHELQFSYSGFETRIVSISLHSDLRLDTKLSENSFLAAVTVTPDQLLKKNTANKIPGDLNNSYNYFLGENDPVRSLYLFPGVLNVPENFGSLQVRGGGPDENLFLLDGTQVYNPSHLMGALSIVNQTVLKTMKLYKSDFPARFSGSLSSVIDVYTKDGNMARWQGEANAGIMSGAFTIEGPLVKNKTSFMGSFRHGWGPVWGTIQNNLKPDFYDINGKITQLISKSDKLMINFYSGQDNVNLAGNNINNLHQWGNLLGSVRWNHLFGSKSFINTIFDYSEYQNLGGFQYSLLGDDDHSVQTRSVGTKSNIEHYNGRIQGEFYVSGKSRINAGLLYNHSNINPLETKLTAKLEDNQEGFSQFQTLPFDIYSGYLEWEFKPTSKFFIRPGLNLGLYQFQGYSHYSFQPRLYVAVQLDRTNQLFVSYNKMVQYLHLVANPYLGLNTDIWVPSTDILKPEESQCYTAGYNLHTGKSFILSIAGYWKSMTNITNYANGQSFLINSQNWQQNIESGRGWSYGMESQIQWSKLHYSLQLSYTLSWNWRQFNDINDGEKFPYKYDRRHILNLGLAYHISDHFDFSGLFSFSTGDAFTLPSSIYPDFNGAQQISSPNDLLKNYRFIYEFNGENQFRSANYYRADAAIKYHSLQSKKLQSIITAGVYNISGSADQYSYDLIGSINSKSLLVQTANTSYNLIPYISYSLKF